MNKQRLLTLCLLALVVGGCGLFGGLKVETVATSYQKPSNVAVYLSVTDDQAVPPLTAQSFRILEGGQLVPADQSKQTLLDRSVAAEHRTLLLLDMSGTADALARKEMARGAARFAETVSKNQAVHVYGFDGRAELLELGDFPKGASVPDSLDDVERVKIEDTSSNLYGAVVEAVHTLGGHLTGVRKPIRIGTLVVYLRNGDQASRQSLEDMIMAIEDSGYLSIAVGYGEDFGETRLDDVGHDHTIPVPAVTSIGEALAQAGAKADAHFSSHYLLSYCSPGRSGMRDLEVEVAIADAEGGERTSSAFSKFDSTGFAAGCDPNAPPSFVTMARPPVAEEAPEGDDVGEVPAEGEAEQPSEKKPRPAAPGPKKPAGPRKPAPKPPTGDDSVVPPPTSPDYAPD